MSSRYIIEQIKSTVSADSRYPPPRLIMPIKTMKALLSRLVMAIFIGCLAVSGADAAGLNDRHLLAARDAQEQTRSALSQREAEAIVSRATGGQVLNARPSGQGYDVRVLLDKGRVRTFHVDANGSVSARH